MLRRGTPHLVAMSLTPLEERTGAPSPVLPDTPQLCPPLSRADAWGFRLRLNRYRLQAWLHSRRRATVLIDWWPNMRHAIEHSVRHTGYRVSFGPIPPGGNGYDVVFPPSPEAARAAAADPILVRRNPLPLPSADAIDCCDDKAALNAHLRQHGFGVFVPPEATLGRYPYILKRRRDSFSRHAHCIAGPEDEQRHAEHIASPDYLRQVWVDGRTEYAAHILRWGGQVRHALTVGYTMAEPTTIRGRDSLGRRFMAPTRFSALFNAMLESLRFEGLCCVNYKIRNGRPALLEINPRAGSSVAPFLFSFIRHLDWSRAEAAGDGPADEPRGRQR